MKKRDFILTLGDRIYKNAFGFKACVELFKLYGKGELSHARSMIKKYCEMNSLPCAELTYFNDDCSVKCWFIYENGKIEKFV